MVWTSGGLDELEIHCRLGVREVWQWDDDRIQVFILRRGRHAKASRSALLPDLHLELLTSFLDRSSAYETTRDFHQVVSRHPTSGRRRR